MSLKYLWKKLDSMNSLEQEAYIKNIFQQFNITPIYPVSDNFENEPGKEASGKNPLGYLIMHLDPIQIDELIPVYYKQLMIEDTFSTQSRILIDITKSFVDCLQNDDKFYYFPYKADTEDIVEVFSLGVKKYYPWSFLSINPYKLIPAIFRHLYKYFNISHYDEETGLSHLAHANCNRIMLEHILNRRRKHE